VFAERRRRWRWAALGAVVLAAVPAFAVSRNESPSGQQRALREDPLGRFVPRDGRLVQTYAGNEDGGGMLSMQHEAQFGRLFALPPDAGAAAMQETIDAATAAGWVMEPPVGELGSVGNKQLSTGKATMSVGLITDARALPDNTAAPVLSLTLLHSR
jgi:hypothetical protein